MSLYEFLYVDSFDSAEDYTVHQLALNKGSESCITKEKLTELAGANGIEVYKYPKKEELVKAVYSVLGKEILKYCSHTGAAAYSFMLKFRLMPGEVERFAAAGLLEITGDVRIYKGGKSKYINLYSAEQYFNLTDEKISEWRNVINEKKP